MSVGGGGRQCPGRRPTVIVVLQLRCTDTKGAAFTYAPRGWFVPEESSPYPYKLSQWVQCPGADWASGVRGTHTTEGYLGLGSA